MAVLVMEEEEEAMVEEDLDMATRVGAMEVVMTTMEEVTFRLKTFQLQITASHLRLGEACSCMLCKEAVVFQVI